MSRTRAFVLAGLIVAVAGGAALGQTAKPFVPPVKGQAIIEYIPPVTKAVGNEVITTIRIKNVSQGRIAGLRVDEFWYDKSQNPVTGAKHFQKTPIEPGEIITVTLKTPKDPKMFQNQYNFSHANGTVKANRVKSLDAPAADAKKKDDAKKK